MTWRQVSLNLMHEKKRWKIRDQFHQHTYSWWKTIRLVYGSPASLPGKERWVTYDKDVRDI